MKRKNIKCEKCGVYFKEKDIKEIPCLCLKCKVIMRYISDVIGAINNSVDNRQVVLHSEDIKIMKYSKKDKEKYEQA